MHLKTLKHTADTWFDTGMLNCNINMGTQIVIYCSLLFCSGDTFDENVLKSSATMNCLKESYLRENVLNFSLVF